MQSSPCERLEQPGLLIDVLEEGKQVWLNKLYRCEDWPLVQRIDLPQYVHNWETQPTGIPLLRVQHRAFRSVRKRLLYLDSGNCYLVIGVEDKCGRPPISMKRVDPLFLEVHKYLVKLEAFI